MSTLRADAQPSLAVVGLQLASGLALTYPLQAADAVFKTNYQPLRGSNGSGAHYENTLQAAQALVRRDGYLGLLRGVAPHFAWTVLYSSGFESFYQIYRRLPIDKTPLGFVAAQDFALAAWRAVLSPLTTIVTRLVVRPSAYAELGARDGGGALATVGLGDPRALWRAATDASERRAPWTLFKPSVAALELVAALTGTVANSLVSVPLTEILVALVGTGPRRGLARLGADEWKGIATLASVAAAGVAVRFANVAVETVSKRLQAQHGADDADDAFSAAGGALKNAASSAGGAASASAVSVPRPKPYAGALDAFATIVDEEGWQGLFHGWGVQLGGTAAVAAATVGLARYNGRV